jgi:hypothetical protein
MDLLKPLKNIRKKLKKFPLTKTQQDDISNKVDAIIKSIEPITKEKLVELWTIGSITSRTYVILEPAYKEDGKEYYRVINGEYMVIPNKQLNTMYISYDKTTHESHYLGDIKWLSSEIDEFGDVEIQGYDRTIDAYEKNKKIVGMNLVEKPIEIKYLQETDEPPF